MLSRIPVHRFAALSLLTWRASIAPMPIMSHRRLLSDSPAATTTVNDDRRWMMLNSYGCRRRPDDSLFAADEANTVAESRTSQGRRVRVSFRCAAPPSSSYLYYDFPDGARYDDGIRVVAANGELVLLAMKNGRFRFGEDYDYFVYRPADADRRRPPLLSVLPVPDFPTKSESAPASSFDSGCLGLLRRGKNDHLVVHVDLRYDDSDDARWIKVAVISVLRPGMRRWELMKPVPVRERGLLLGSPSPAGQHVICVGDRFVCWVSYWHEILLCDMADEASPKARYVDLPPEARRCRYGSDDGVKVRRMGVAGDNSVRFVSIHPHCCSVEHDDDDDDPDGCCGCGYHFKRKECWHPRYVFTIKTWTMNLSSTDERPLEWVEDGEIDSEEIWELPGYEGLPQAFPEWPVVCLDEPNVVCFLVSNYHFTRDDETKWMVQLNIATKTLLSVVQLPNDDYRSEYFHLPAEF